MIKKEYQRLLNMLEQSVDFENFSLEEILKESVVFFEVLRQEFPKASKEEREEMVQMMSHLHGLLQAISKKTSQLSGMSEEELAAYSENPSNFTPEQWQVVQDTKRKLYDSARKFSASMEGEKKGTSEEKEVSKKEGKKPIRSRTRRTRRKDWKKT